MVDHLGQIIAGARVVGAGAVVGLARAAAPVDRDATPAEFRQLLLLAEDIQRAGAAGQAVQQNHAGRIGMVRPEPVEVEKVAVGEGQPLALAMQQGRTTQQGAEQGLQVAAGQPARRPEAAHAARCHRLYQT